MTSKKRTKRHQGTRLTDHTRDGKRLIPPYAKLPNVQLSSWRDERLPEMIWAALICAKLNRDEYLQLFRDIAATASQNKSINCDGMGHSRLAILDNANFDTLFSKLLVNEQAISALAPLRLLSTLPDRCHWFRHIPEPNNNEAWDLLSKAVADNSWHQSEIATDIRWLKVNCLMASGKMIFSDGMQDQVKQIYEYPNYGDLRMVRPSIRAAEMAFVRPEDDLSSKWPEEFWLDCLKLTRCISIPFRRPDMVDVSAMTDESFDTYSQIAQHFHVSLMHTDVDARHDSVFGICLYAVALHTTLLSSGSHQRVQGRLFIRTIVELYIMLAFLLKKDSDTYWKRYRLYGHGQAKLAFLKLVDLEGADIPSYVQVDELENLANEDKWQEFVEIDFGNWSKIDLRRMSEDADVKDIYDRFYSWPSGYVHGHWGAVRDTIFDLCANSLHRYHRIPALPRLDMGSVAPDSVKLINLILDLLAKAYPPFKVRLKIKAPKILSAPKVG